MVKNVPHLEIIEVVLVYFNIVNNDSIHVSKVLYMYIYIYIYIYIFAINHLIRYFTPNFYVFKNL